MTTPRDDLPTLSACTDVPLVLRCQGIADGARSLGKAARLLRTYACLLETWEHLGWHLEQPVADDQATLTKKTPSDV